MDDPTSLTAPAAGPSADSAAVVRPLQRRSTAADRSIRVTHGPKRRPVSSDASQEFERPTSSGSSKSEGQGLLVVGKPSRTEGLIAKVCDWADGSLARPARPAHDGGALGTSGRTSRSTPADFTSLTEDPDRRRLGQTLGHAGNQSRRRTLEEQWRAECLASARGASLTHVEEMRCVYYEPRLSHRAGHAVVVVVGSHYRSQVATKEELLLYCVQEAEKLGSRPFVVLYFNADASLTLLPDSLFFTELHAALPPGHRDALHAVYAVHPTARLKAWALLLRVQEPAVYGKVVYLERLQQLMLYFGPGVLQHVPEFVKDYDLKRNGRR